MESPESEQYGDSQKGLYKEQQQKSFSMNKKILFLRTFLRILKSILFGANEHYIKTSNCSNVPMTLPSLHAKIFFQVRSKYPYTFPLRANN